MVWKNNKISFSIKAAMHGLVLLVLTMLIACGINPAEQGVISSPKLPLTYTIEPLVGELVRGKDFPVRCVLTNVSDTPLIVNLDFLHYGFSWRYEQVINDTASFKIGNLIDTASIGGPPGTQISYVSACIEICHDTERERVLGPGESLTEYTAISWPEDTSLLKPDITQLTFEMGYQYPCPASDTARYTDMIPANPITVRIVPK